MSDAYVARVLLSFAIGALGYVSFWLMFGGARWQTPALLGAALASFVATHSLFLMTRIIKEGWKS